MVTFAVYGNEGGGERSSDEAARRSTARLGAVSFDVAADAYDAFIGRYSRLLAPQFADFGGVRSGHLVLDVGCGPGALIEELAARVGADAVAAVDPSEPFVAAARARYPGVDVLQAAAEVLPFPALTFDVVLAQLVVHFMTDPLAGLTEMRRVARSRGVSLHVSGTTPGAAVHSGSSGRPRGSWILPSTTNPGSRLRAKDVSSSCSRPPDCGTSNRRRSSPTASTSRSTNGGSRSPGVSARRAPTSPGWTRTAGRLRERCRALLPDAPFVVTARAWAARGIA